MESLDTAIFKMISTISHPQICEAIKGKKKRAIPEKRILEKYDLCQECCNTDGCNQHGCADKGKLFFYPVYPQRGSEVETEMIIIYSVDITSTIS